MSEDGFAHPVGLESPVDPEGVEFTLAQVAEHKLLLQKSVWCEITGEREVSELWSQGYASRER